MKPRLACAQRPTVIEAHRLALERAPLSVGQIDTTSATALEFYARSASVVTRNYKKKADFQDRLRVLFASNPAGWLFVPSSPPRAWSITSSHVL